MRPNTVADRHRYEARGDADEHRDTRTQDNPAVHVSPELISAERKIGRRPLQTPNEVLFVYVVGGKHIRENANEQEHHHNDQAEGTKLFLAEQPRKRLAHHFGARTPRNRCGFVGRNVGHQSYRIRGSSQA